MKNMLLSTFRGKDKGALCQYLGNLIDRDRSEKCLYLDQRHFVKTLLYRAGMETAHGKYIPIQKEALSEVPSNGLEDDQSANFRSIVGALLHVSTTSRPDIAYAVGRLSRHMKEPVDRHLDQAKYLLRYTQDFVLKLGGPGDLHGYVDADFANESDRKSIGGYAFYCGDSLEATREAMHLFYIRSFLGYSVPCTSIRIDNAAALDLIKNPLSSSQVKHIDIFHHYIREREEIGMVGFSWICSDDNVADVFTKPMSRPKFEEFRSQLGVILLPDKFRHQEE
jgi:hypothetical protein